MAQGTTSNGYGSNISLAGVSERDSVLTPIATSNVGGESPINEIFEATNMIPSTPPSIELSTLPPLIGKDMSEKDKIVSFFQ